MKSAVVGDTWYLMGWQGRVHDTDHVYSVSLSALIFHINNTSERIWNKISSLGLYKSTPLCMGESLVAGGGMQSGTHEKVSTLLIYTPHSDEKWTEGGQLPIAAYDYICTMTSNNSRILVAQGLLKMLFISAV